MDSAISLGRHGPLLSESLMLRGHDQCSAETKGMMGTGTHHADGFQGAFEVALDGCSQPVGVVGDGLPLIAHSSHLHSSGPVEVLVVAIAQWGKVYIDC